MKRLLFVALFAAISFTAYCGEQISEQQPRALTKHTETYAEKDGRALQLDHYIATGIEGVRPCVIFVFGGGFAVGTRDNERYLPYFEALTANGYDVVSIDYRLGLSGDNAKNATSDIRAGITLLNNAVKYATEDALTATRFLLDHAEEWQINPQRIILSGSSAGAITSLQAEYYICNRHEAANILPADFNYAAIISFAGAIFSVSGSPKWESTPCPIMFFHGNADCNVPYNKASVLGIGFFGSEFLVKQLDKMGASYYFQSTEYRDHELAVTPMIDSHYEILSFLNRFVERGEKWQIRENMQSPKYPKTKTSFSVKEYLKTNYSR